MASWDPGQYERFADARLRPALDLLARLPDRPFRAAIDLGCGGGQLTALLRNRFPALPLTGIDSSPDMLAVAARKLPDARFRLGDICDPGVAAGCDLVASNAAFQWVPDHRAVLEGLMRQLPRGGALAVQMPGNHAAPSHRLLAETVAEPPFAAALAAVTSIAPVDDAPDYAARLLGAGALEVDAWTTTYVHRLAPAPGSHPVLEWVKGTALRPYLDALPPALVPIFTEAYRRRLAQAYPLRPDGQVLFPFRRVFMVALA